ncbi:MAG: hypothetical protein Q4C53_00155 [Clostridia bacterium]|nr:hypothetical protein [Clostridia bacterium]
MEKRRPNNKRPVAAKKPSARPAPKKSAHDAPAFDAAELRKHLITLTCAQPAPDAEAAQALSALTAMAKKKAAREELSSKIADTALVTRYLNAEAFKVRKNTARFLGAMTPEGTLPALAEALDRETVLMVVPSILLALGSYGTPEAEQALMRYVLPVPTNETEEKNVLEIADARRTALRSFHAGESFPEFERFDIPTKVLLTAPEGMNGILFRELTGLGLHAEQTDDGCTLTCERLAPVFRARCFSELLVPVAAPLSEDPASIAAAFAPAPALPYRAELRNYPGDRTAFIKALSKALGGVNDPSHYAVELRVDFTESGLKLYRKPVNFTDPRYGYRKQAISASIRPETAACLIRFARENATKVVPDAHVLDPFAGSGTFLFERETIGSCASLTGVDIKQETVRIAMDNARAGRSAARFIAKDCLRFIPREPADELYANLPFGNRVGTHESNETLYRAFVKRLPELLRPSGFALLYTMEFRLLERCIRQNPALVVRARTTTEAGGLLPHAILVERAQTAKV